MDNELYLKQMLNLLTLDLNLFKESIKEVSRDVIIEGFS